MLRVHLSTDSFSIGVLRKVLLDVMNPSSENFFDDLAWPWMDPSIGHLFHLTDQYQFEGVWVWVLVGLVFTHTHTHTHPWWTSRSGCSLGITLSLCRSHCNHWEKMASIASEISSSPVLCIFTCLAVLDASRQRSSRSVQITDLIIQLIVHYGNEQQASHLLKAHLLVSEQIYDWAWIRALPLGLDHRWVSLSIARLFPHIEF